MLLYQLIGNLHRWPVFAPQLWRLYGNKVNRHMRQVRMDGATEVSKSDQDFLGGLPLGQQHAGDVVLARIKHNRFGFVRRNNPSNIVCNVVDLRSAKTAIHDGQGRHVGLERFPKANAGAPGEYNHAFRRKTTPVVFLKAADRSFPDSWITLAVLDDKTRCCENNKHQCNCDRNAYPVVHAHLLDCIHEAVEEHRAGAK